MRNQKLHRVLVEWCILILLLSGCGAPAVAPTTPTTLPLIASLDLLVGTWQPLSDNRDAMFLQVNADGACRQSYTLEGLNNAPQVESTCSFEGTLFVMTTIKLTGVQECPSPTGKYEVWVVSPGQIRLVAIEENCARRKNSTQHTFQSVP